MTREMLVKLVDFSADLYDVLGMNTDTCTQEQFFEKYVEKDEAFELDVATDKAVIYFDEFEITIKPKQ